MARVLTIGDGYFLATGSGYYASAPPSLALSVVSTDFSEGATVTFRVTASKLWDEAVTVAYATSDGTATENIDYIPASGTVALPPGSLFADVDVVTIDRDGVQANRTFTLTLSSAMSTSGDIPAITSAAQTVTIIDTDVLPPIPHIEAAVAGTTEEGSPLTFRVSTVGLVPTPTPITFQYETQDGTAVGGTDYTPTSGSGFIAAGEATQEFQVSTLVRSGYQASRTVIFAITSANTGIDTPNVTGRITDTDLPVGDNAYFDALVALGAPTLQQSWSLRSTQDDIDALTGGPQPYFTYQPTADTYESAQDATKWRLPQSNTGASSPKQMRFPISPAHESGRLLITWDTYYTPEMLLNRGGVNVYKMFQVWMSGNGWWTHTIKLPAGDQAQGYAGTVSESVRISTQAGLIHPAIFRREPLTNAGPGALVSWPDAGQFPVAFGKWTRYWWEIIVGVPYTDFAEWEAEYGGQYGPMFANPFHPSGHWNKCSLWVADNTRGPVRLVYRAPLRGGSNTVDWESRFNVFRFEMNTSQSDQARTGDLLCYFKNVVFLKNYELPSVPENDTFLFQRPV